MGRGLVRGLGWGLGLGFRLNLWFSFRFFLGYNFEYILCKEVVDLFFIHGHRFRVQGEGAEFVH
jgi:hypothetical protein